ncbi:aminoacylase-1-like isoform X3 [Onthophagus taurus]|uniref:aminoacylase-1-like isoform X3 n=1 Tax=Onthophagus taurus TaxID=166361 RepID=UPI0039BEC7B9
MSISADQKNALNRQAVENFQEYLRIPSVHPNINYDDCVSFLQRQAKGLGLPLQVYSVETNRPIVIITWVGTEPSIPSIMLNSHMDVVPVFEDSWTHKPFAAEIDEKGNIYARGAQDMKCVGIQYLEAIRRMIKSGIRLRRTLHVTFVPEEELGGVQGMKEYVHTTHFKNLNVGFALDEGMANESEEFILFYGERFIWHMHFHCPGQPGHGSLLFDNTPGEKARIIIDRVMDFRAQEKKKLADNPELAIGDVTTLNITQLKGGVQTNVIPEEFIVSVDCRLPITVDEHEWQQTVDGWCKEAGSDVWIQYEQKQPKVPVTKLDNTNPYWIAFKEAMDGLGLTIKKVMCPARTDINYLRNLGLPALGFSPMIHMPALMHAHNEYHNVDIFLRGIDIYIKIITTLGNMENITK